MLNRCFFFFLVIVFLILFIGCDDASLKKKADVVQLEGISSDVVPFAQSISAQDWRRHLQIIASDAYEGRPHGSTQITQYLKDFYENEKIPSPKATGDYFQKIPKAYIARHLSVFSKIYLRLTQHMLRDNERFSSSHVSDIEADTSKIKDDSNVIAYIKGGEKPEEVVVITAHMDHLGNICPSRYGVFFSASARFVHVPARTGCTKTIYNGADDNGSGTVALLEIAEAFKRAQEAGVVPKRSVAFIHFAVEEAGLLGSRYYIENPVFTLKNTVLNLNLDMVGRVDTKHSSNPNYVYVIGADIISTRVRKIHELINKKYVRLTLEHSNESVHRSDQHHFIKKNIPAIFYTNGTHDDYHKPTDDADKINYQVLEKRTRLAYYAAWEFANRTQKIK